MKVQRTNLAKVEIVREILDGINNEGLANYINVIGLPTGAEQVLPKNLFKAIRSFEKSYSRLRKEIRKLEAKQGDA